jgi:adenine-specific DNA-methyltransferase
VRAKQRPFTAQRLRSDQTGVERRLWFELRDRRFYGHKFRRQVPVGPFIVDFACWERSFIIELDGGQHNSMIDDDRKRTQWLEGNGWRVLRFWNNDVIENMDGVLQRIAATLESQASPHPNPLPHAGEGGRKLD